MVDFKREALVSTEWLADNLGAPDLRVVDASYYLPGEGLDPRQEFEAQHIPGAVFFDIDAIKDPGSELPHMLPPPHIFSAKVRRLGLGDGLRLVIYDQRGIRSEEHTSELQSLMRISYAVFCLKIKNQNQTT